MLEVFVCYAILGILLTFCLVPLNEFIFSLFVALPVRAYEDGLLSNIDPDPLLGGKFLL